MASKLGTLRRELGYESIDEMLETAAADGVVPGICTAPGCNHVEDELEPDCKDAHCPSCSRPTLSSCLIIAGMV